MMTAFTTFLIYLSLASRYYLSESFSFRAVAPDRTLQHRQPTAIHSSQSSAENENTWRSALRTPSSTASPIDEARELCSSTPHRPPDASRGESGLAFLFVSQRYIESFGDIVSAAHDALGNDVTLLSIVGGGAVGGGEESDDPATPAMSLLCGILPSTAGVEVFMFGPDEAPPPTSSKAWNALGRGQEIPSYVLFADPFSRIQDIVDGLDSSGGTGSGDVASGSSAVVAGGISCPVFGNDGPTVAINGRTYPRGSAVGLGLSGTVGLQAVVAQGCRPVGSVIPHRVTGADGNMIEGLDGRPAVEVLGDIDLSDEEKRTVERFGVMCGLAAPGGVDDVVSDGDYLIRQIIGFRVPGIMIGSEAKEDQLLKFHVRDPVTALEDLQNMINRARTERSFRAGEEMGGGSRNNAGTPLAALQVSCVARGRALFGRPNVDVEHIEGLIGEQPGDDNAAIGGFFANGEIGPVGIAGVGLTSKATHIHAFTAVACVICDFGAPPTASSLDQITGMGASLEGKDDFAWG